MKTFRIPLNENVDYHEKKIPLDPYFYGAILATIDKIDGDVITVSTNAVEDISELAKKLGIKFGRSLDQTLIFKIEDLKIEFDKIPNEYKYNSRDVRKSFTKGFFTYATIISKARKLSSSLRFKCEPGKIRDDLIEIFRSLGMFVLSGLDTGIGFRCNDNFMECFQESKFKDNYKQSIVKYKSIKNIERVKDGKCTCIVVDNPEHLFLVNDYIVTHNTVICALSFVLYVMNTFEFQNAALIGKSIGSLKRNVLSVLKQMLFALNYECIEHRAENWMEIRKGGISNYFFLFGGKDEAAQDLIQGMTLCSLFCDEVALIHKTMFYQASARLSVEKAKIFTSSNPSSPNHWFFREWITKVEEKNGLYLHFTMDDNPSLPLGVKQRYKSMYSGIWADRYIKGLWVIAEGLIYDMFNKKINIIDDEDIPYENAGKWNIGIDYGTGNATVFLLSMKDVDGNIYVCREYYFAGRKEAQAQGDYDLQKTDLEFTDDLRTFITENFNITNLSYRSIPIIIDPSAASFKLQVRRFHMKTKNADNSVLDGIRTVATLMKQGRLKIAKSCINLIDEICTYSWDQRAQDNGIDRPLQVNDHACDAMRYSVMNLTRNSVDDNIGHNVGL